jgi:Ca-activated chloride channel family protein
MSRGNFIHRLLREAARPLAGWAALTLVVLTPGSELAVAQETPPEEPPRESVVTVALPADEAAAVEVVAGGEALPFRVMPPEPWQVAIYFDQLLSDPRVLRNATVQLADKAGLLADLGPVQILLGGETVRSALPPTTDSAALADALAWLRIRESSADAQASIRVDFAESAADGSIGDSELQALLDEALLREAELIRVQREGLLLWATEKRAAGPRLLLLVGSGYDSDPSAFYQEVLDRAGRSATTVMPLRVRPTAPELGQALAVTGWTVLAYAPGERGDALVSGPDKEEELEVVMAPDGREIERGVISFDPTKLLRKRDPAADADAEAEELQLLFEPLAGPTVLAEATGGFVVTDSVLLDDRIEELSWRTVLAVQAPVVGDPVPLEVRSTDPRRSVGAPAWLGHGAPAALSVARARYLAASGESSGGELQIAALVAGDPPVLAVELSSAGVGRDLRPPLRLTVAELEGESASIVEQRELGQADIARGRLDLTLPERGAGERPIVVVVDELSSNRWGGVFAGYTAQADGHDVMGGSTLLDLPQAAKVRLLAPQDPLLVGRTRFAAVIADPGVVRVDFLLDGEQEAVRRTPPFEAELDLGTLPRTRRVEVVARDADGEEIGRDVLLVNSGNSELSVKLEAPGAELSAGGSVRASGELLVEAEVAAPRGIRVAKVDFFWREDLIGTLYSPPYRQRVDLPPDNPRGFVRALVTLADGAVVEEVLFVNTAGSSARVQVTLVEVLAVVTDGAGNPVSDLERDVFTVREEGEPQELAAFSGTGETPLTVGVAIDASASMFIKLPRVQVAAMEFLRELLDERDRGFVVSFGSEPELLAPTTGELSRLIAGVEAMRPDGFTSIWKGVVYSLVQLQGTPGKKALIVYSDGADEDPDFSYRIARRFARVVGVPIYVILSNNEIVRTQGRGLNIRGFLGRLEDLVDDVGGKVYFTRVGDDLEEVYAEIADELRSQYVLGYYGEQDEESGWRKIEVEVSVPGLEVRSARGRYP